VEPKKLKGMRKTRMKFGVNAGKVDGGEGLSRRAERRVFDHGRLEQEKHAIWNDEANRGIKKQKYRDPDDSFHRERECSKDEKKELR